MSKVRKKNEIRKNLVLTALLENGELSLSDLKNYTGITLPVLSNIISILKKENFVVEQNGKSGSSAGRPPAIIKLNGKAGFILGIDIGRLFTNYIVLDLEQNIITDIRKESISLGNDITVVDKLEKEIKSVLNHAKVPWNKLLGIGISLPGLVRGKAGTSETYFNFGSKSAKDILSERFKKPIHIEHDLKAMALGELWFGAAKNVSNALCINVGWGLGMGMIIDGKIYYGKNGYAGELGHIQIVPNGELCYCGKRGCLETVSSGKAITNIAREKIKKGATTILTHSKDFRVENVDAGIVLEAANKGDQFSIEIIEESGKYLGKGIATLINIFDPSLIILGGGVSNAAPYLIEAIRSNAMKHSLVHVNKDVKFVISKLGSKSGALGVAMYLIQDLFDVERLNPRAYV